MNDQFESRIIDLCVTCRTQARGASRSGSFACRMQAAQEERRPGKQRGAKLRNIVRQPTAAIPCVFPPSERALDLGHFESPRCCHCGDWLSFIQKLLKNESFFSHAHFTSPTTWSRVSADPNQFGIRRKHQGQNAAKT